MKLKIEQWLENKRFDTNLAENLFREAITCYKSGAYRAGLLFSVTAFQRMLKDRIIYSDIVAASFEGKEEEWETLKINLKDESIFDREINQVVDRNSKNTIFDISTDLKQQYRYWTSRRNDCAHGKTNMIESSHVEAFWAFIISNEAKFYINGGEIALIREVEKYLDNDITPMNANPIEIIKKFEKVFSIDNCEGIFREIINLCKDPDPFDLFGMQITKILNDKERKLLESLFTLEEYAVLYIKQLEEDLLILAELLCSFPDKLRFIENTETIRLLWKKILIKRSKPENCRVFLYMLNDGMISEDQREEAIAIFIENISYPDIFFREAGEAEYFSMKKYCFPYIKNVLFEINEPKISNFSWSNAHKWLIRFYLCYEEGLSENDLRLINRTFSIPSHPFGLAELLKDFLNEEASANLRDAFEKFEIDIPQFLLTEVPYI